MAVSVEFVNDAGAHITVYRFSDFPGGYCTALCITSYDHLLDDVERVGWTGYGDGDPDQPPLEYPPASMAVNDWFDDDGEAVA